MTYAPYGLTDLSGNGHPLVLAAGRPVGVSTGPLPCLRLAPGPDGRPFLFSPGWDDMWFDAAVDPPTDGIDFRWWGDLTELLPINPLDPNVIAHQGSAADNTFGWAVRRNKATGLVSVVWSTNGTAGHTITGPAVDADARCAVWFDPHDGSLTVYTQPLDAPEGDYDADLGTRAWELVGHTAGGGATSIHASPAPVRQSGQTDTIPAVDSTVKEGWGNFHRITLRNGRNGVTLADLDPSVITMPLTWEYVSGYPSVGPYDTAAEATFTGRVGEDWTIHNFVTPSTHIAIVDRAVVILGSDTSGRAVNDPHVVGSATGSFSHGVCVRTSNPDPPGGTDYSFSSKYAGSGRGWTLGWGSGEPTLQYALVTDGSSLDAGKTALPGAGEVATLIFTYDATTDVVLLYVNGVVGTHLSTGAVGNIANLLDLIIGAQKAIGADEVDNAIACEFVASATWDGRVLTAAEVALVTEEWLAGGRYADADDYTPVLAS